MRHLTRLVYCGAGAAVIMLAGCSGGGGGIATPATGDAVPQESVSMRSVPGLSTVDLLRRQFPLLAMQGSRTPTKAFVNSAALAKQPTTIAVSSEDDVVNIYDPAGDQLAQLTGFDLPAGLASDSKGDLYVADLGNQRVQIYAAGFTAPPTTLSTSGYLPYGVDSFNNKQIVAVANVSGPPNFDGPGSVQFFTNGQLTNTVSPLGNFPYFVSCAFDAVGNLYVVDANSNAGVGEIIGGAQGDKVTQLTTQNVLAGADSVQVTTDGKIAVLTSAYGGSHKGIYTYNPPVGNSLGKPVITTSVPDSTDPYEFAFTKDMASLYQINFDGTAEQYAYPAGGKARSTINTNQSETDGIAVIPTQNPKVQK